MMELNISPNFTVEDIHKVREYNYERTKNMTFEEYKADLKKNADKARNRMQELKEKSNR